MFSFYRFCAHQRFELRASICSSRIGAVIGQQFFQYLAQCRGGPAMCGQLDCGRSCTWEQAGLRFAEMQKWRMSYNSSCNAVLIVVWCRGHTQHPSEVRLAEEKAGGSQWGHSSHSHWDIVYPNAHRCIAVVMLVKVVIFSSIHQSCCWHHLPFLSDSIKCGVCRLLVRSAAAVDEAHQTMASTWEFHENAKSQKACDYMLSGRTILRPCKCVVSTLGHVLCDWKSHIRFLRL